MNWPGSLELPGFSPPRQPDLPAPILEIPKAELPSYRPVFIPPAGEAGTPPVQIQQPAESAEPVPETRQNLQRLIKEALRQGRAESLVQPAVKQVQALPEALPATEVTTVVVPGTQLKIPVPKAEILSAAATTSVISVGATLAATSMFKRLVSAMKPAIKAAVAKVQKLRGKKVETWGRRRLRERRQRRAQRKGSPL